MAVPTSAVSTPTSTGAYTTGIRSELNKKGITNDRITYNPTTGVMIDGKAFGKPDKVYNGAAYTSQQNFNNAWDNYNKSFSQPTGTTPNTGGTPFGGSSPMGSASTGYNPYNNVAQNPYTSQADQIIKNLLSFNQNQSAFDPYSSNSYKAAQAQAQRATQQGIRQAQEAYGSSGFGRSTALGERSQGIANDANEYLLTQVVPQIEAQESARRQQEYNNVLNALQPLLSQQGRADQQVQQGFNNAVTQAQLTGNYLAPGAQQIINQLLGLKQQAESQGVTADQRTGLSQQADALRSQLQGLGVNSNLFGANVSASQAGQNVGKTGIRTLAGQQQDLASQGQQFDQKFQREQFAYQQARDKIADQQYKQKFDEDVRRFGLEFALNSAVQNRQLAQGDARIALDRDQFDASQSNQATNQLIDIWRTSGVAPQGIPGVAPGTPYTGQQQLPQNNAPDLSELGRYFDGVAQRDPDTNQISNPDQLENAILNSAVSDYDAYQLYNRYGLKWDGPVPSPN